MLTACQRDSWATEGVATVLEVRRDDRGWDALLDDAVLYAEGGGQPSDTGTVAGVAASDVRREEGGLRVRLAGPVPEGPAVVRVDWERRFDHMQQHTAQHLLTAVALTRFGLATTSFHLHPGLDARCDLELDTGEIDEPTRIALEDAVQREIRAARPVRQRVVEPDSPEAAAARSRGLPDGFRGPVRLIEIEGLDLNTCGGTHLRSTAEIGALVLLGTERLRGGVRLHFVAGDRVRRQLRAAESRLAEAGALLSRAPAEVPDGLRRLAEDARAASKARDALAGELADALGDGLLASADPVRVLHREHAEPAFLNRVASRVLASAPDAVVFVTEGGPEQGSFLLAGPAALVGSVRAEVLERLGARGGGPPGRLQGRATKLGARDEVSALLAARFAAGPGGW